MSGQERLIRRSGMYYPKRTTHAKVSRGSFFPKKEEQEDVRKQKQLKIKDVGFINERHFILYKFLSDIEVFLLWVML